MSIVQTGLTTRQQRALAAFVHAGITNEDSAALARAARGWYDVLTPDLVLAAAEGMAVHLLAQWNLDQGPDEQTLDKFAGVMERELGELALLSTQARQLWLGSAACPEPDQAIQIVMQAVGPAASDPGLLAYNYMLFVTELVALWSRQTGQEPGPVLELALSNL
jgi:hypothetical protein